MTRILLIDDDRDFREMLARVFLQRGYEVALAADGVRGLQRMLGAPIDVIVLDLNLPYRDGVETLKLIRAFDPHQPVVVVTAAAEQLPVQEAHRYAVQLLTKPVNLDDLEEVIRRLAGSPDDWQQRALEQRRAARRFGA